MYVITGVTVKPATTCIAVFAFNEMRAQATGMTNSRKGNDATPRA